ncbi:MAG TPA: helix-turn-helix transcriptional regulator [Polyangia bacterium]|nr:helix-turn-helix transcriptional regulator [Polyangia bacterium]
MRELPCRPAVGELQPRAFKADAALSRQERAVLEDCAHGTPMKLIADRLGISENTVGGYVSRAKVKLGLQSRSSLQAAVLEKPSVERARKALLPFLTRAELDVALELFCGRRNAEIASRRGTSIRTVDHQVRQVLRKLQIGSRFELVPHVMSLVQRNCL